MKHNYSTKYLYTKAMSWKKFNIKLEVNTGNLQTKEDCENLIKAGQKMNSVAGIFIVSDIKQKPNSDQVEQNDLNSVYEEIVQVMDNLDKVSRKMCSGLSYFVHISVETQNIGMKYALSACERICENRKEIGLPALTVSCKGPNEVHINNCNLLTKLDLSAIKALFSAMDISLKNKNTNVFTEKRVKESSTNYIQQLEGLIGVQNIEDIDEHKTVQEICINEERLIEVQTGLAAITNTGEDLSEISIGSLKKVCKDFKRKNRNFNAGLEAFYNFVDGNEYNSIDVIIPMNTHFTTFEEIGYFDRHEPHLMMLPGFEGHCHIFNFMARRIKIRAASLQFGPDLYTQSIPEVAKMLAKLIKLNFEKSSKFYILGYSFGVNVAMEIAKILEDEGQIGVVYCLDSSPDALKIQLKAYAGNLITDNLEINILKHMFHLISKEKDLELEQNLIKLDSWPEKLEYCVEKLRGQVHFSSEHIKSTLQTAYERIIQANEYEPTYKLKSEIVLIKGIPHPQAKHLSEDYNLSKYSTNPIKVFNIESDHVMAPYDCRVSNIVNRMLDPKILEEFRTKNLCDVYYRKCKAE